MSRLFILLGSCVLLFSLTLGAHAAPRTGPHGKPKTKTPKAKSPEEKPTSKPNLPPAEPLVEEQAPVADDEPARPLTPALALANMIYFEYSQGIHDYTVQVLETATDLRSEATTSIRKELYFLGPATTLTLQDGQALNILNAELFGRFLDGVDLTFEPEETIGDVLCYVVKVTPKEGAFKDNAKWYYLAKDDFRKMRIRAIKSDSIQQKKFWFINDFSYKKIAEGFLLPANTQARLLSWEEIPLSLTTAVFMNYAVNKGLEAAFFEPYLKDMKFNDTYKD